MAPQQVPVYRHICIFINKAFCSFLLSSLALTLGSPVALWSPGASSGVGAGGCTASPAALGAAEYSGASLKLLVFGSSGKTT